MMSKRKHQVRTLLKGIETGDPNSVTVVNPNLYIQHNPQTQEGGEGLATLFKRLSKSLPRVNLVRVFEDGNYIFAHTEYDFATRKIGFEVFRFEEDFIVEHWDNIQERKGPNSAGLSMVDGLTEIVDLPLTDENREFARRFVEDIFIKKKLGDFKEFTGEKLFKEHNPTMALTEKVNSFKYDKIHRVLAEGNFVLTVSEGTQSNIRTAYYDLFRIEATKIVEHWDTIEIIPPRSQWKNNNGKF